MDSKIQRFFRWIKGKRIAVLGIGVTNTGLVRLLSDHGAKVTACDRRDRAQLGAAAEDLEAAGASLNLGPDYLADLDAQVVFRTPGMSFLLPELTAMRKRGVVVTSEMEVFFLLCPCRTIAVTGSDGKTTSTTLIAEMLREQGFRVHLGGNIGRALLPDIMDISPQDIAVVELSSFQLISMRSSPDISVITNIAPNHLDVHGDMTEYIDAKKNIFIHQDAFSRTVLNLDNDITASFADDVRGELCLFSLERSVKNGAFLQDGVLCFARHGEVTPVLPASEIRLPGVHNVANYLTAMSAVRGLAGPDAVRKVAREFGGVEHRIEFVRELDGVKWYNDSIATSPTRAIAGLKAFDQKLVIIAGGYDKKIPFEPLAPHVIERVKLLILTGATAGKMKATITAHPGYQYGSPEILMAENLEVAVHLAHSRAVSGDIVSLSPACASFDSFPNFEARGRYFKDLVGSL